MKWFALAGGVIAFLLLTGWALGSPREQEPKDDPVHRIRRNGGL